MNKENINREKMLNYSIMKINKYRNANPCWAKGMGVKKITIKKSKLIINISGGEYYTLHRTIIKQKKITVNLGDIDLLFNKYYVIVYLLNGKIKYSLEGIPNGCNSILLLYGITVTVGNGKISDYTYEDLRGKYIVSK